MIAPEKFVPSSQPIRCKTKNNRDLVIRYFPPFKKFSCFHVEFSLANNIVTFVLIGGWDYFGFGFGFTTLKWKLS